MANPMYGQNKFDNQVDNANGDMVHVVASADGTAIAGAETKVLASADAGNRYFVDISSNTGIVLRPLIIPPIPRVSAIVCFKPYSLGISKSIIVEGL